MESNRGDEFIPLSDIASSLIPPADPSVPAGLSSPDHGAGDGRTGEGLFFAGPREGSSGIDEGLRSGTEDDGAQEVCCDVGGHGDGDLESAIGNGSVEGGNSGVDNAGSSKPAGYKKRFDLDPEGRIKNLIWTTGRSRRQYTCFGDVVVFDTTYTTNLYKLPFGLFVGVNNHFQTVIYAGILMSEETIEGFNWAYTEFVSLMGGKAPLTMLTDQCRAMEVAIGMTLPGTIHRWCKWHVFRKAKEELGGIFSKKTGFKEAFNKMFDLRWLRS